MGTGSGGVEASLLREKISAITKSIINYRAALKICWRRQKSAASVMYDYWNLKWLL